MSFDKRRYNLWKAVHDNAPTGKFESSEVTPCKYTPSTFTVSYHLNSPVTEQKYNTPGLYFSHIKKS